LCGASSNCTQPASAPTAHSRSGSTSKASARPEGACSPRTQCARCSATAAYCGYVSGRRSQQGDQRDCTRRSSRGAIRPRTAHAPRARAADAATQTCKAPAADTTQSPLLLRHPPRQPLLRPADHPRRASRATARTVPRRLRAEQATQTEILHRLSSAATASEDRQATKRHTALEERLRRMRDLYELGDLRRAEYVARREAINAELSALTPAPISDLDQARACSKTSRSLDRRGRPRRQATVPHAHLRERLARPGPRRRRPAQALLCAVLPEPPRPAHCV
jgi:hypothetical protein